MTLLPGLLIARHLGDSSEAAKQRLVELWRILRPALLAARRSRRESGEREMELTPREKDKLLIFTAALLAERRKAAA